MNYAQILGGQNGLQTPGGVPPRPQAQAPGGPMGAGAPMAGPTASGINPMALLSMGQQQMGRAFGGNPYDANAMAEVMAMGLMGAGQQPGMPQQRPMMPGRTPGFNPAGAL